MQAVLADPVLLRAVDPHVLQAVLVQAATANLQLELDTSHHQLQLPSFPATPPHLNISAHPALPPAPAPATPPPTTPPPPPPPPTTTTVKSESLLESEAVRSDEVEMLPPEDTQYQFQTRFGPEEIVR